MIVLGVDAALANLGLAVLELGPRDEPQPERVLELSVVHTEPGPRRHGMITDDARRVGELALALHEAINRHRPRVVIVESTGAGRGFQAVRKMALALSIAVTIPKLWNIPLVLVSPLEVKRAMTGSKKAEKDDVILAAERRFPELEWTGPESSWEHAADAIGAVVAALPHERLRMLREGLCR